MDYPDERIIFAIDNGQDLHTRKKFLRYVDNLQAMDETSKVSQCIGMWEGELETSYMMLAKDYERLIAGREHVKQQACVMRVPGDTRQPCVLEYPDGSHESIGPMVQVTAGDAMGLGGWTYVEETGKFYTTQGIL